MDVQKTIGGSLQISTEVLAKIARLAALEIDGVAEVTTGGSQNVRGLLGRTGLQKPVNVVLEDGIATVTVHLTAVYGSKIMPLCEKVQENVKQTIQNMSRHHGGPRGCAGRRAWPSLPPRPERLVENS